MKHSEGRWLEAPKSHTMLFAQGRTTLGKVTSSFASSFASHDCAELLAASTFAGGMPQALPSQQRGGFRGALLSKNTARLIRRRLCGRLRPDPGKRTSRSTLKVRFAVGWD